METAYYTAEVKGGRLLELPAEAEALQLHPGDKVRVQLDPIAAEATSSTPNEGMLAALREIAARQNGRRHTDGSQTDQMLRQARAGEMWGCEPVE
jgi:hypothetical protein